jgi:hypothetical protein
LREAPGLDGEVQVAGEHDSVGEQVDLRDVLGVAGDLAARLVRRL